jgi:hypothetical protein
MEQAFPKISVRDVGTLGMTWSDAVKSGEALSIDTWHHVAATFDGSNTVMYVDGVETSRKAEIHRIDYDPYHEMVYVGGSVGCCQFGIEPASFPGVVDGIRIFSVALSPEEIGRDYAEEK